MLWQSLTVAAASSQTFISDFIYSNLILVKQGFSIHFVENFFTLHGQETANGNFFDTDMEPKAETFFNKVLKKKKNSSYMP